MLKRLTIENYRCFDKTEITFRELTIIVGKNNAGKSTLIEALRILATVVNRCKYINYSSPPDWINLDNDTLGISPSISNLDISTKNIFYMYGSAPAILTAIFDNKCKIVTYIGEDSNVYATLFDSKGVNVGSKNFATSLKLEDINILPQITPLLKTEPVVKFITVQRNLDTNLSSRNFRNQLNYYPNDIEKFRNLTENSWEGLSLNTMYCTNRTQGELHLLVRDKRFEAEIGWMGHGLQMWLQTMWFLARCSAESTVILDEPDVYMHADLQRRLIKIIKSRYHQIMIATHSVEIMSEVEAENILPIDNTKEKQTYANNAPLVQKIIDDIGSVHNIEIARLFSYKKLLIVEGEIDDVKLLSIFQSKIFLNTFEPLDVLPKTFVEGWGGWQRVIGSNKVFRDNDTNVTTYCILDSDYHLPEEKIQRLKDAKTHRINLHIWRKKEIENYLIVVPAILRLINKKKKNTVTEVEIEEQINLICNALKDEIIDNFAQEIQIKDKIQLRQATQKAREYLNPIWEEEKMAIAGGKQIISSLSMWATDKFKVNINKFSLAREISIKEIDDEVIKVISCIENCTEL